MEEATAATGMRREPAIRRRLGPFVSVALAVLALDQATKMLVRTWLAVGETWPAGQDVLRLTHVENAGAAFGILQGGGAFLLVATVIGVIAVTAYLLFVPGAGWLYTTALAFILGGALGNLVDRATRSTVTDFIDPTHYPAFNLADSAIVVGVGTLAWLALRDRGGEA